MNIKIRKIKYEKTAYALMSLVVIFGFFSFISFVVAENTIYDGFKAIIGVEQTIDAHGDCKKVTNNSANDIFIPTRTDTEWQAFQNNLPAGTIIEDCCNANMGNVCDINVCQEGTIQCDGSCGGTITNKANGTNCPTCSSGTCECQNGSCVDIALTWQLKYSDTCLQCGDSRFDFTVCSSCDYDNITAGSPCGSLNKCSIHYLADLAGCAHAIPVGSQIFQCLP